jgi:hypothetical protein
MEIYTGKRLGGNTGHYVRQQSQKYLTPNKRYILTSKDGSILGSALYHYSLTGRGKGTPKTTSNSYLDLRGLDGSILWGLNNPVLDLVNEDTLVVSEALHADNEVIHTITPVPITWADLRNLTSGGRTGRLGTGGPRRSVLDPDSKKNERENRTIPFMQTEWPEDSFIIEDVRDSVPQKGADFLVLHKATGALAAKVDSKSANCITYPQMLAALQNIASGIPYWLVDPIKGWKMQVTKDCNFEPMTFRVTNRTNQ